MGILEKARIKLLDKNTGQVLKEVDPFTSADAVTCEDTETVQKKVDDFNIAIATNATAIAEVIQTHADDVQSIANKDLEQDLRLTSIEILDDNQEIRLTNIETKNTTQESDLTNLKLKNTEQDTRLTNVETKNDSQDAIIASLETKNTEQDTRLTNIETKNTTQDTKITNIQTTLTTMQAGVPSKLIVRTTDPGSAAAIFDVWLDLTSNTFKVKQSNGTWKIVGAAYN